MTRDQLVARCATRYKDTSNRAVTAAEWADLVNDAYLEVIGARPDWPFLNTQTASLSVTGGTGTVSLPSDVTRVASVYNATDKWPLSPIPGQGQYRSWFPDPANSLGSPQWYRLRGTTLEVYPWPASTTSLTIDHPIAPAALGASDEPAFPEQWHRILVLGALSLAYEDDLDSKWERSYRDRFDRMLSQMIQDLLTPQTEGYPEIIDTF